MLRLSNILCTVGKIIQPFFGDQVRSNSRRVTQKSNGINDRRTLIQELYGEHIEIEAGSRREKPKLFGSAV